MICFRLNIVGGPFDGARGLAWIDDGEHPPPDRIFLGVCGQGRDCGLSVCAPGLRHVAYWTADEDRPSGCISYRKENEYVERNDEEPQDRFHGHAVYVIGGLLLPGDRAEEEFATGGTFVPSGPLVTA